MVSSVEDSYDIGHTLLENIQWRISRLINDLNSEQPYSCASLWHSTPQTSHQPEYITNISASNKKIILAQLLLIKPRVEELIAQVHILNKKTSQVQSSINATCEVLQGNLTLNKYIKKCNEAPGHPWFSVGYASLTVGGSLWIVGACTALFFGGPIAMSTAISCLFVGTILLMSTSYFNKRSGLSASMHELSEVLNKNGTYLGNIQNLISKSGKVAGTEENVKEYSATL
ncbi:MAG: hypothetical protein P1U74_04280 [Legionellaceae bacterium]|nr:hypothetical protein [Legionellaceae bacterium]